MDATDLNTLAGHLRKHGLQVDTFHRELRLRATNPVHELLTEEITAAGGRYVTSFDYEIGEQGHESECARRIAYLLTGTSPVSVSAP
ncbi:hypothetical protein ACWF2L_17885 [Streptomyces anulatus]